MKYTPLHDIHKQLGARMVDFAGWEMPVLYTGVVAEHLAVRNRAGLFDVSHMGELEIIGPGALALVQKVTCNDASRLTPGACQYSALLTPEGTFVDDIIVYRKGADHFLICVNASNADKDFEWVKGHASTHARVENNSDYYALMALQGPKAKEILQGIGSLPMPSKPFTFVETTFEKHPLLISRTGYTGEDGVEIYTSPADAPALWNLLMEIGKPLGLLPCGLGARDTLRLEACYPLYGHEIDDHTNPFEAGLNWIVKLSKEDFIGKEALSKIRSERKLVGLQTEGGIARQGYRLFAQEEEIGFVTSGTHSPLLDRPIALGYVKNDFSEVGTKIQVDIRGKKREAIVVSLPFYKKKNI